MLDTLVGQIIVQAPAIAILLYIMAGQDRRINELTKDLRECVKDNKKDD